MGCRLLLFSVYNSLDSGKEAVCILLTTRMEAFIIHGLPGLSQKFPLKMISQEKNYKHMSKYSTKRETIHRPNKYGKFTPKNKLADLKLAND